MLRGEVLAEGDGYIALRSSDSFLLLFYQYCHYDRTAISHMLSGKKIVDPYMMCKSGKRQVYTVEIGHVKDVCWNMETYGIGRRLGGNLYESWHRSDYPNTLNEWQKTHLEKISLPFYQITKVRSEDGTLHISRVVDPHDVILIRLQPSTNG